MDMQSMSPAGHVRSTLRNRHRQVTRSAPFRAKAESALPALFREADVERSQPVFNSHRRGVGGGFPEERLTSRLFHSPPSEACRASSPPTGKRPSEFRERPCRCRARKFHLQEQSLECAASRLRPTATLSERRSGLSWHTFLVRADPQIDADAPPRSSCR